MRTSAGWLGSPSSWRRKNTTRRSRSRSRSSNTSSFAAAEAIAPRALNTWMSRSLRPYLLPPSHDADADLSPATGGADEVQGSADGHGVLPHQLEPEVARVGFPEIEATAIVGYLQRYLCRTNLEHQVHVCRTRVFGQIVQRFPSNSKQGHLRARRNIRFIGK